MIGDGEDCFIKVLEIIKNNDKQTALKLLEDVEGIYIPEKFGIRIEDMALITENGCKNLTNAPKELIVL